MDEKFPRADVDVMAGVVRNCLQLLRNIHVVAVDSFLAGLRGREDFRVRLDNDAGAITGLLRGGIFG